MNVVISIYHTEHNNSSLVSICDYFRGCLLWCQYHIQHSTSVLSKKAPEKVVTDGYEGGIYVQCGHRWIRGSYICAVWSEMDTRELYMCSVVRDGYEGAIYVQ